MAAKGWAEGEDDEQGCGIDLCRSAAQVDDCGSESPTRRALFPRGYRGQALLQVVLDRTPTWSRHLPANNPQTSRPLKPRRRRAQAQRKLS